MDKINVDELSGQHLDYWVERAEGRSPDNFSRRIVDGMFTRYSDNWDDAGPIIDRERIAIAPVGRARKMWFAEVGGEELDSGVEVGYGDFSAEASSPLVAAMRAFVKSKFGHEVDAIPLE